MILFEKSFVITIEWNESVSTDLSASLTDRVPGAAAAVGAARACGAGDEAGHHVAGGGAVPQNIHQETRECQVHHPGFTRYFYSLSNIFAAFFLHRTLSRYL